MKFDNPTIIGDANNTLPGSINPLGTMTLEEILAIDYDNANSNPNLNDKEGKDDAEPTQGIDFNVDNILEPDKSKEGTETKSQNQQKQEVNTGVGNTDYENLSNIAPAVAQLLADNGFFTELPPDVDEEQFDEDALIKTFKHNLGIAEQKSFDEGINYERQRLSSTLPETGIKLLEFLDNPNLDEDEIKDYLRSVIFENDITRLDPEDSFDAEKIVRAFYEQDGRFTREEVDTKIADLVQSDRLKREASILKPKVDAQASKLAQEQANMKKVIQDQEKQLQGFLVNRTKEMLNKGKLNGIPMTREDAELAYKLIVNNDIPIPVKGGKQVEMGYAELEIFKHKYTKEGNLERLALGLLVMAKGESVIERYFAKQATTEATKDFINKQKFNFQKKSGQTSPNAAPKSSGTNFSFPLLNK